MVHFISPSIFRQASISTCVSNMNDRVRYGEFEILTNAWV